MKLFSIMLMVMLTGLIDCRAVEPRIKGEVPALDRSIRTEPEYGSPDPLYCLLVFGPGPEHRVWLVHDCGPDPKPDKQGRVRSNLEPLDDILYVDRNGNGDLTNPGERITATAKDITHYSSALGERTTTWPLFKVGDLLLPDSRTVITDLTVEHNFRWFRRSFYQIDLQIEAKGKRSSDAPLWFSTSPDTAPVVWFDGPLTVRSEVADGISYPSRYDGKEPDPPHKIQRRFSAGSMTQFTAQIGTKGDGPGSFTAVSLDEIPESVHPVAQFTFPHRTLGRDPLTVVLPLSQRVWGNRFAGDLAVPADAAPGKARVRLTVAGWGEVLVAPGRETLDITSSEAKARAAQQGAAADADKPRR